MITSSIECLRLPCDSPILVLLNGIEYIVPRAVGPAGLRREYSFIFRAPGSVWDCLRPSSVQPSRVFGADFHGVESTAPGEFRPGHLLGGRRVVEVPRH
mmetsp:Transcript_48735/g.128778  ORF Transcript_48735/g.128778 Transcript_48735/m.128778 type:complete len:99 (+) Transcript_48735:220-516(+)